MRLDMLAIDRDRILRAQPRHEARGRIVLRRGRRHAGKVRAVLYAHAIDVRGVRVIGNVSEPHALDHGAILPDDKVSRRLRPVGPRGEVCGGPVGTRSPRGAMDDHAANGARLDVVALGSHERSGAGILG